MSVIVTIDGGAGTGTSSLAAGLAEKLGSPALNSGHLYRGLTLLALDELRTAEAFPGHTERIIDLAQSINFGFKGGSVIEINGLGVEESALRSVSEAVPHLAHIPEVRLALRIWQHRFAEDHECLVAEGRDLGTVVFPDATRKIFLVCDDEERARRRSNQAGRLITVGELLERDRLDSERDDSPMRHGGDAIIFDTTKTSVPALVKNVINSLRGVPAFERLFAE